MVRGIQTLSGKSYSLPSRGGVVYEIEGTKSTLFGLADTEDPPRGAGNR